MARSVNKVILIGHLGDDPELRYTQSGTAVCNMSLATDESYVDSDGNEIDRTEWHDIVAWGRLAEICGEHLSKGSQVHFEGSLQTNKWEDRDGNERYSTEVKAREMMFLDGNRQSQPGSSSPGASPGPSSQGPPSQGPSSQGSSSQGSSSQGSSSQGPPSQGGSSQGDSSTRSGGRGSPPGRSAGEGSGDSFEPGSSDSDEEIPF